MLRWGWTWVLRSSCPVLLCLSLLFHKDEDSQFDVEMCFRMFRTCCVSDHGLCPSPYTITYSQKLCVAPPQFCGQQLPCCAFVVFFFSLISMRTASCNVSCFDWAKCFRLNYIKASFVPVPAGYDFCAEGLICGENSECKNRNTKAECECRSGYASIHGDSTYCEGRTPGCTPPKAV